MIDWHHLFGWTLMDYFTNSNYRIELEKDLSTKPQFLDVVIIEESTGSPPTQLPDGLENLSKHNLLTYKSLQEALDTLVIAELLGYYINYRKLLNPKEWDNLPLSDFRLYAVTTRYPRKLKREFKTLFKKIKAGVYDLKIDTHTIRIIVLNNMPKTEKNAVWQLFSGNSDGFKYGNKHYQWRYPPAVAMLEQLLKLYQQEGIEMPYTLEQACLECARHTLASMPPTERLKGLSLPEIIQQFSPNEVIKQFSPNEVFKQFSPQVIKEYLAELEQKNTSAK